MSKKLARSLVAALLLTLVGCARSRPVPEPAAAPLPVAGAPAGAQEPTAAQRPVAREPAPEPRPVTSAELDVLAPPKKWPVPKGKLDDARFVALSARYLGALVTLPEPRRTQQNILATLETVLSQEGVSPEEFRKHAEQVSSDPKRRESVGAEVVKLVNERLGIELKANVVGLPGVLPPEEEAKPDERQPTASH